MLRPPQTKYPDAQLEGWLTPNSNTNPFLVRGPFNHTTAIVVKLNSEEGTVSVITGNECVASYATHPTAKEKVTMVLLKPGYYCWCMKGAEFKFIKQPVVEGD